MTLLALVRRPATGAVLAQGTQALAGLVLQVAAARYLGAAGLAAFALGYGLLVLATAVCSGLVGDSLTVLDRHEPRVRAGLHSWTALVSIGAGAVGLAGALLSGALPLWAGLLLGPAAAVFIVEDLLRRLLMATGRFWSIPVVDGTGLLLSLGVLLWSAAAGGLALGTFVVAVLVGQTGALAVAWWRLPPGERPAGPWRRPAWRVVASFGVWRAAAQTIRPALLTALRLIVVAGVGAAAYGPLEAARVLTAPTLVLVAGLGSFLLPHFVAMRERPAAEALRTADRVAVGLAAAVAVIGVLTCLALPVLGPWLSGGAYPIAIGAVAGWSAYAVSVALLLPYSALATVHRRHRRVLALRSLELVSLTLVLVLVQVVDGGELWTPLALATGPVLVAVAVRAGVLRPVVKAHGTRPEPLAVRA